MAAKVMKLIGEEKASKGRRIVKNTVEGYIDSFAKKLNEAKLNTHEGRAKVTAAALLLRYDGYHGMTSEEEFQAIKKDLATNVKNHENDNDISGELEDAKIALEFANRFATKRDLVKYINNDKPLKGIIRFVQNEFSNTVDEREAVSQEMFNTPLLRVASNYVPKKVILSEKADESKPFEDKYEPIGLKQKQSGSINKAQAPGNLGKNRLNLDILAYSSFELEKVMNEIHLSEARLIGYTALNNKAFKDKVNNSTARLLQDKLEMQYNPKRSSSDTYILSQINEAARQIGTAAVLGGFTQPLKQFSVVANIATTLGVKDSAIFIAELATGMKNFKSSSVFNPVVKTKVSHPIHDMYSIGNRVEMNVGIDRGETAKQRRAMSTDGSRAKGLISKTLKGAASLLGFTNKGRSVASDLLLYPMHLQDIFISTATWNAAYKGYLSKNGITDVNMATEHSKIDSDPIRQEAAAYAEQIVGVTQIPSDPAQRAEIMKDSSLGIKFLRGIVMPFSNFAINSVVRKFDAIRGLFISGRRVKSSAELTGLVAEAAAFSYSKYLLAIHIYPTILNSLYQALTGDDEELIEVDDEEKKKRLKISRDFLIKDLLLQGTPESISDLTITGINNLMYNTAVSNGLTEEDYDEWAKTSELSLYQYKKPTSLAVEGLGVYGIVPSKLIEAYSTQKLREDHIIDGRFGEKKVRITSKEEDILNVVGWLQYMNALGIMDADVSVMSGKAKKSIVDNKKSKERFI
jgi:hypothetical protein